MICKEQFIAQMVSIVKDILPQVPYSFAISGSNGKKISDSYSDFDFRLYIDAEMEPTTLNSYNKVFMEKAKPFYEESGYIIDGIWPRLTSFIDHELDKWLTGSGEVIPYVWTIWGYHILTDIYNQIILDDPYAIAQNWKNRLTPYPSIIKEKMINSHMQFLQYWCTDYHFKNKINRGDVVFIASLHAKLIHHILQIVYALNSTYYPGDGGNLKLAENFKVKPYDFENRVSAILFPTSADYQKVYESVKSLIEEVIRLI